MLGRAGRVLAVLSLLAATHAVQVYFLREHPQPILFGDAKSYHIVGQRFARALASVGTDGLGAALEQVRGVLYFSGVGLAYAGIDAVCPGDVPCAREVLAGFNTLAALGAFLLARRLSGRFAGGLLALGLAAVYPSFAVQTGRLLPDPLTGCLFVWSAWLFTEGVVRERRAWWAGAGLVLGAGLLIRSQLLVYVLVLLGVLLAATARRWLASPACRRGLGALAVGLLPAALAWGAIVAATGDDLSEVEALGNFTFRTGYPYGFWQFLDSDGWMGPFRLRQEPYYRALASAAEGDPALLESRPRQWVFTAGYVAGRPVESVLLLLDNAWRLYDRPANDYKRDFPMPYPAQVWLQRTSVLLALVAAAGLARQRPALLGSLFVPSALTLLHVASYPWPRFNQPAMPILLGAAATGVLASWAALRASSPSARRCLAALALLAAIALGLGAGLRLSSPEPARVLRTSGVLALLAAPFALFAWPAGPRRRWPLVLATALGLCFAAHEVRDRRWHEVRTDLARTGRVEQEIRLGEAALARLRGAAELFLAFDLLLPHGSARDLSLEVSGRRLPGELLEPTMPPFGESVEAGGRDPDGYPQWWVLRLDRAWLPSSTGALRVALESGGREPAWLGGDRFAEQQRVYEGPSFGDWPHRAAIKLEYDGDYRLGWRAELGSDGTRSRAGRGAARRPLRRVHRIRLLALADRRGRLEWETGPVRGEGAVAAGFFAFSGTRGEAWLRLGEQPTLPLPLAPPGPFRSSDGSFTLCHVPGPSRGGMRHGGYLLYPLAPAGRPQRLELGFEPGMNDRGMFFSLDRASSDPASLAELARACGVSGLPLVDGVGRVFDASRNSYPDSLGRWSVAGVF